MAVTEREENPQPLTKDVIFWHIGSNVISFVFRNLNQKGGNPLKRGKITSLYKSVGSTPLTVADFFWW